MPQFPEKQDFLRDQPYCYSNTSAMFDLSEKVCLVTGASRGIGLAFVDVLLQRGAKCLMVDVDYRVILEFLLTFPISQNRTTSLLKSSSEKHLVLP